MQVTNNSQLQMQAYSQMQQTKPALEQTTSNKTLQSDTVTLSNEALSLSSGIDLQRGGGAVFPNKKKEE
ncbi:MULTISPECIES: hypothetical protein [Pseudoalteromonas]|jgi:hypothetical protein|uniref:Orphan protein n=1 Tax=Pseudoalteromonas lipolytica TaxID=570156 RepID=A0ABY1GIZ3_9GAMM|nr:MULTISPECIES: hypothetical protein [Pseudoalteromonas]MBE0351943.1 hypothetical protein [Pseudoalteromonas lipolytica LMEB 39]MCC9661103.1 hypothetical protein [Pseudoalteromonas sp. MB41]SFT59368.1 hypothetical protein SAMN04487854_105161 [Pseudoalteromonas lipolytica]